MSPGEREALILRHLPRVQGIAARIHGKVPWGISLDDLVSVGILGLIAAVDRFDPRYEVKFQTYAEYKIRGAILDSLRGVDGIPEHKRGAVKRVQHIVSTLEQHLGRAPMEEEVAEELGFTLDQYRQFVLSGRAVRLRSLDAPQSGGGALRLGDVLAGGVELLPSHLLEQDQLRRVMHAGLALLPEAQRRVVTLYFLENLSLREIAERIQVHVSRVSQLKIQGMERLRRYVYSKWHRRGAPPRGLEMVTAATLEP